MKNNREKILRDLEYVSGGITTFKALCKQGGEKFDPYHAVFDEWQDTLCSIIDMVEEDYENAAHT